MNKPFVLAQTMTILTAAALKGDRCPTNYDLPAMTAVSELCKEGRIRVYISGHNYRQVEILQGPAAGAKTAPDPHGHAVWKIVDTETKRIPPNQTTTERN